MGFCMWCVGICLYLSVPWKCIKHEICKGAWHSTLHPQYVLPINISPFRAGGKFTMPSRVENYRHEGIRIWFQRLQTIAHKLAMNL